MGLLIMDYTALAIKIRIRPQGYWLAAGAICSREKNLQVKKALAAIEDEEILWPQDPVELDRCLAAMLSRHCLRWVPAAAAVLAVKGRQASTGGVIGSPHRQSASAYGGLEELEKDLVLWARPGGPGFVFAGPFCRARALRDRFLEGERQKKLWNPDERYRLFNRCLQEDLPAAWLYAADGSGRGQKGILAAGSLQETQVIKL